MRNQEATAMIVATAEPEAENRGWRSDSSVVLLHSTTILKSTDPALDQLDAMRCL